MIYKFKSQAAADVIMLEPHGRQVLQIIGKDAGPQGIVTVAQIPAAIAALQAAVADEKTSHAAAHAAHGAEPADANAAGGHDAEGAHANTVSLAQRATPFIDLLQRSAAENRDVVWGV